MCGNLWQKHKNHIRSPTPIHLGKQIITFRLVMGKLQITWKNDNTSPHSPGIDPRFTAPTVSLESHPSCCSKMIWLRDAVFPCFVLKFMALDDCGRFCGTWINSQQIGLWSCEVPNHPCFLGLTWFDHVWPVCLTGSCHLNFSGTYIGNWNFWLYPSVRINTQLRETPICSCSVCVGILCAGGYLCVLWINKEPDSIEINEDFQQHQLRLLTILEYVD